MAFDPPPSLPSMDSVQQILDVLPPFADEEDEKVCRVSRKLIHMFHTIGLSCRNVAGANFMLAYGCST